jgi:hypothetical protein
MLIGFRSESLIGFAGIRIPAETPLTRRSLVYFASGAYRP